MKTQYERHKAVITDLSTGKKTDHKFINAAKRASRELQGSALGQGLVRVKR
jgi:hypothetical protein